VKDACADSMNRAGSVDLARVETYEGRDEEIAGAAVVRGARAPL